MAFTQDSDPIKHMGIGLIHYSKALVNKADSPTEIKGDEKMYFLKGNLNLMEKNLSDEDFKNLPPFKVEGNFFIDGNNLKSLKGCPTEVHGSFSCTGNPLESLDHLPVIKGNTWIV